MFRATLAASLIARFASAAPDVDAMLARAQAMMARGEYQQALEPLEAMARDAALTQIQRARLYVLLAAARSQTGHDEQALTATDHAERDARALDAFDLLSRVESIRGIVWLNRGRALESLQHLQACVTWAERSHQPALVAGGYIRLAAAYQDLGDWTRALDALNHGAEADPHPSDENRIQYLTRRGLVEMELRERESAERSIRDALELARRIGDRRSESQVLGDLALVYGRIVGDGAQAAAFAAQSVDIARAIHNPHLEITGLNDEGSFLRQAGQMEAARARLTEARALIARVNEHRDEPFVLKNLGQVLVRMGRLREGERVLRQAIDAADATGRTRIRWLARLELAMLHAPRDAAQADREFAETLAILEEQQTNVLLEGFRAGALDQALAEHDPYDRYITFLLDRGEPARAFHVAERERARAFLDTLSNARESLATSVPAGFAGAENALLRGISSSQAALRGGGLAAGRRRELQAGVERDEVQLTALRLRLAAERPALAHARFPSLLQIADVQSRLLAADELLVSFFLGVDRSVCWIIDRRRFDTVRLPPRREIEQRVREALQEVRNPTVREWPALSALSRTLAIDRWAGPTDAAHLIIVPHGILFDVPFEALTGTDNRRLIERAPMSYAPSASSLAFLRSMPRAVSSEPHTLLAIGNPIVRGGPESRTRQVDLARVDLLAPLPQSADEMRQIADLFGTRALVLEGVDATETALRSSRLENVRVLHFATHGLIDEVRPDRSALALTASPPDDGLLQTREIYALPLRADLVTLSACQTALGRNVTGEGMIGLSRAFFYAGARAVLASLWDVEDASTARFMQRFYANIRAGEPIDVALQHAKLAFIRGAEPTSRAFFWAPFVVSGLARSVVDVEPGDNHSSWRWRVVLDALIAVIVLAAAGAWWRRSTRSAASTG